MAEVPDEAVHADHLLRVVAEGETAGGTRWWGMWLDLIRLAPVNDATRPHVTECCRSPEEPQCSGPHEPGRA